MLLRACVCVCAGASNDDVRVHVDRFFTLQAENSLSSLSSCGFSCRFGSFRYQRSPGWWHIIWTQLLSQPLILEADVLDVDANNRIWSAGVVFFVLIHWAQTYKHNKSESLNTRPHANLLFILKQVTWRTRGTWSWLCLPLRMVMLMTGRTSGIWYWTGDAGDSWKSQHRLQILDRGLDGDGTQHTSGRSTSSLKHTSNMATGPGFEQTQVGSD